MSDDEVRRYERALQRSGRDPKQVAAEEAMPILSTVIFETELETLNPTVVIWDSSIEQLFHRLDPIQVHDGWGDQNYTVPCDCATCSVERIVARSLDAARRMTDGPVGRGTIGDARDVFLGPVPDDLRHIYAVDALTVTPLGTTFDEVLERRAERAAEHPNP